MVQLSYIKEVLDNDFDFQNAATGDIVIIEVSEQSLQLPLFSYAVSLLCAGKTTLMVLTKHSYFEAVKQLNQDGIDLADVYFIDCISKRKHVDTVDSSHVVELEESVQLQTVFGTLLDHTDEFSKNSLTAMDDLGSLKDLSPPGNFLRFFHLLLTKLRNKRVGGFMLLPQGTFTEDEYSEVKTLVDKVIHL